MIIPEQVQDSVNNKSHDLLMEAMAEVLSLPPRCRQGDDDIAEHPWWLPVSLPEGANRTAPQPAWAPAFRLEREC